MEATYNVKGQQMKELKAVEILTLLQIVDDVSTRQMQKEIQEALAELQKLTQEKSCKGCELEDYIKPNFTPNGCAKCNRNPNSKLKDHYTPKG